MMSENLAVLAGAFVGSCAGMIIGWYARDVMRSLRVIRRLMAARNMSRKEERPVSVEAMDRPTGHVFKLEVEG